MIGLGWKPSGGRGIRPSSACLVVLLTGCVAPPTRLDLVDFSEDGSVHRYTEAFDEAYFDLDEHGNLDLILRRAHTGGTTDQPDLTQIVHVHSVWRSLPGTTIADDNQINATFRYALLGTATGHSFDGAGSVFYQLNDKGTRLTGTVGRAVVKPSRQIRPNPPLLSRVELRGSFHASRDARQVRRLQNDLRRIFGNGDG